MTAWGPAGLPLLAGPPTAHRALTGDGGQELRRRRLGGIGRRWHRPRAEGLACAQPGEEAPRPDGARGS